MPYTQFPYHHGSHRHLLWTGPADSSSPRRKIDAIVVPTARPPAYLLPAAELARTLRCKLVTLHSKRWTTAAKAAERLPRDVDLIAIDITDTMQLNLPCWQTSRLLSGTVFASRSDLSAKRNLALVLSHLMGWSRILFLDDDITELNAEDVRGASGLLGSHHAVGLHIGGFPDHSVVCHAYQQAGGEQQEFVSGGALAVAVSRANSFFPDVYNDDWFFLLDGNKSLRPTAVTGKVKQYPYDPFRNADRARHEELGDVLAEGIYWLLDQDRFISYADENYWGSFLEKRRLFIESVLAMVRADLTLEPHDKARRIDALKGSIGRLQLITPALCESYLLAWAADMSRWQRHVRRLPTGQSLPQALAGLSRRGCPPLKWHLGGTLRESAARRRFGVYAPGGSRPPDIGGDRDPRRPTAGSPAVALR